jgi:hypothetical protein
MAPDTLNHWRRTIKQILTDLAAVPFPEVASHYKDHSQPRTTAKQLAAAALEIRTQMCET